MEIYFKRTGGFMGRSIMRMVDTAVLPHEKATALRTLVTQADFFELPSETAVSSSIADQFEYTVLIDDGKTHRHRIKRGDSTIPSTLWPLMRELTTLTHSEYGRAIDDIPIGDGGGDDNFSPAAVPHRPPLQP